MLVINFVLFRLEILHLHVHTLDIVPVYWRKENNAQSDIFDIYKLECQFFFLGSVDNYGMFFSQCILCSILISWL